MLILEKASNNIVIIERGVLQYFILRTTTKKDNKYNIKKLSDC